MRTIILVFKMILCNLTNKCVVHRFSIVELKSFPIFVMAIKPDKNLTIMNYIIEKVSSALNNEALTIDHAKHTLKCAIELKKIELSQYGVNCLPFMINAKINLEREINEVKEYLKNIKKPLFSKSDVIADYISFYNDVHGSNPMQIDYKELTFENLVKKIDALRVNN